MKILLTFLMSLICGSLQAMEQDEIQETYRQATDFFRQGNEIVSQYPAQAKDFYEKSVRRFERLMGEGGIRNGKIHTNTGNVYFSLGDLGHAILHYRRAQLYSSRDPQLVQNLEYARSRCQDRIKKQSPSPGLNVLFFWHYGLTAQTKSVLFVSCFVIFWSLLSLRLFWRRLAPAWALVFLGLGVVLVGGSLVFEGLRSYDHRPGVILSPSVVARKGDGENYEPAFQDPLHTGTEFVLIEERDGWIHIQLLDGRRAWLPKPATELVASPP
jgi:hypothetical protein